jgi:deoxyinosine 3'endonuclease (endonuclease V)
VITCQSAVEARAAVSAAKKILKEPGVELNPQKMRIVHVQYGFEFLGYKIRSGARLGALYAYPKEKSIRRFMDQVRERTKRRIPLRTRELISAT